MHLVETLRESARRHPDDIALRVRRGDVWDVATYTATVEAVDAVAAALVDIGIREGDRVAVFAPNSPEWQVVDLAVMAAGAVTVPIYATSTAEQCAYILRDAGCRAVFTGDASHLARALTAAPSCPALERILPLHPHVETTRDCDLTYLELLALGRHSDSTDEVERRVAALGPQTISSIIYTSGTTGEPKGVVLTHDNIASQFEALDQHFSIGPKDRSLSFLPLSHALEHSWSLYMLARGASNNYCPNPREVASYLTEVRPTTMVTVPRVLEKVKAQVEATVGEGAKRQLFDWAVGVGNEFHHLRRAGRPRSASLVAQHLVAERAVLSRIRAALGGQIRFIASGGAPLRPEVEEFFIACSVLVLEGYGMTETSPLVSFNRPDDFRFGTVGKIAPGVQVRIADDGEIQVQGPNVTQGYWANAEATAELFTEDGWLRTGDVGDLDDEGFLRITDRIKDLIVTQQGKNVAPGPIENELMGDELIDQAVVIGEGRKYLTALIQPSFQALEEWAAKAGTAVGDRAALLRDSAVLAEMERRVRALGERRAGYEQIQKFRLVPLEMTMEDGDLTPTLKVRRKKVEQKNAELIEQMYAEESR